MVQSKVAEPRWEEDTRLQWQSPSMRCQSSHRTRKISTPEDGPAQVSETKRVKETAPQRAGIKLHAEAYAE